ncbi:uncharacterized protein PRCAT00001736001 [Priceomyces carsonii]|uniref:uncharacterized protein n=1 Tax=Priceomyces carsonii TaxID=28549 RepID=UPI002ED8C6B6|nr:unnamed protein product [Priceomyces carsonii]
MPSHKPPSILRIKRKRDEDPLQSLILEDSGSSKRSKTTSKTSEVDSKGKNQNDDKPNYIFQLDRTDEFISNDDASIDVPLVSEATDASFGDPLDSNDNKKKKRRFVLPRNQSKEDNFIGNELTDMLESLLSEDLKNEPNIKKRGRNNSYRLPLDKQEDLHKSEYVFDVYRLSQGVHQSYGDDESGLLIGYIRFFENEDSELLEGDSDSNFSNISEEDSNAEDYYQNDYPSDEDAGTLSDSYVEYVINEDTCESEEEMSPSVRVDGDGFANLYNEFHEDSLTSNFNLLSEDKYFKNDNYVNTLSDGDL